MPTYTLPNGDVAHFNGNGQTYTRPLGSAANFNSNPVAVSGSGAVMLALVADGLGQILAPPKIRLGSVVRGAWGQSAALPNEVRAVLPAPVRADPEPRAAWAPGTATPSEFVGRWITPVQLDPLRAAPWEPRAGRVQPDRVSAWVIPAFADRERLAPFLPFERRPFSEWLSLWNRSAIADRERLAPWGQIKPASAPDTSALVARAAQVDLDQFIPWVRFSRPLQPIVIVVTPPGPTPNPAGTYVVPAQTFYLMQNQTTLTRVADGLALPATSLSLQIDAQSWAWRMQATLPASAQALVESTGDPVELQATINGEPFVWLVESIARERSFGSAQIRISGRSRSALLAAPYAPELPRSNTSARTAQQLMDDVLTVNGVSLGWTVDWQLTDWLVPAGAFTAQGSAIDALTAIAEAAGGYIQPHPTDAVLRVLHRYPVAPWAWSTTAPAFELPAAVVQREGIEWQRRPDYNRVFVSGTSQGVLGQVTRAGTAGDLVAPLITDPLITATDAARQRGLAVLADTGRQARVSLRLPVLDVTGVIAPGTLIRYVDGSTTRTGLVRGTQVDASLLEVWQQLEVETHE